MHSLDLGRSLAAITIYQALQASLAQGLERLDGQLLLLHALGKAPNDRAWLLAHDGDLIDHQVAQRFQATTLRRLAGEPVAYLTGSKEFFGLDLRVDARVLVPRPDTETLVEWSLDVLRLPGMPLQPKILDLGTGSGAVALAIAHGLQTNLKPAQVVAVDLSLEALELARENATRLGLNVEFIQSYWLDEISGRFHLIVSNPPYIASGDPHLEMLTHEPIEALTAGTDGLDDLRHIVEQAGQYLEPQGWLLLEHGYDQAVAVRTLLLAQGFQQVQSHCDLAGIERCSGGRKGC